MIDHEETKEQRDKEPEFMDVLCSFVALLSRVEKAAIVTARSILPRRWVVERTIGAWFRRLARDYKGLVETLEGLHYAAFGILFTKRLALQLARFSISASGFTFGQIRELGEIVRFLQDFNHA